MKKFYNSPVVEITVFDVEDIITASAIEVSTNNMSTEEAAVLTGALEASGITSDNTVGWNGSYTW